MNPRAILSLLGQAFVWDPETREYISTVQKDGSQGTVRSRIARKVWNSFLDGINVLLFRALRDIKESQSPEGSIRAVMMFRAGRRVDILLSWKLEDDLYTVACGNSAPISYKDLDRAMQMFSLILETKMNERMQLMAT